MGFSLKRVVHSEETALRRLAECGGLTDVQLKELMSWTGQGVGDVRMAFRGEVFVTRALRKPIIRGCPVCLREDMEADSVHPLTQMTLRGDWQMREVSLCVAHQHPLVPLWEYARLPDRYDLSSRFSEIQENILKARYDRPRVAPSSYDHWLHDRLTTGSDGTWLGEQSLYAAITFCTLLGTEMLRLKYVPDLDAGETHRLAQATGFAVAKHGEAAIRDALFALATLADGHHDEPKKAFGQLYTDLRTIHLDKDDFATFRTVLRDCIVNIWPVAKGECVLGIVQPERQLHSVLTAAKEANIGPRLMSQILDVAGAISKDDDRPNSRKTFCAPSYADLLSEIPNLVGPTEMQIAIGATRSQFKSLAADGVLVPRISIPEIKSPWRVSDGIALLEELLEMAILIEPSDNQWEGIQQSKRRSRLQVGSIIAAVRRGELQLARRGNIEGYAAFSLLKAEIDQMRLQKREPAYHNLITAAAFGRTVGIRTKGWFEGLAAAGHTPATCIPNPKQGSERIYASPRDVEAFNRRFLTPATMEREFGQLRTTILTRLRAAKVETFAPDSKNFGTLYLREVVEAAITQV